MIRPTPSPSPQIRETETNLIASESNIEGTLKLSQDTRIHGQIVGTLRATAPCVIIIAESGHVRGNAYVDRLIIDGWVEGDIVANHEVIVSQTGRLIGKVKTPSFRLEFGGYFDGSCDMSEFSGATPSRETPAK